MKRILVAYDGSDAARRALEQAIGLATALGAAVGVVSVVPPARRGAPPDPRDARTVHARELLEARTRLRDAGIEPELIEPGGDPARTIERVAEERGYDLVVLGAPGRRPFARRIRGSVAEHVASHARVTVIVAR